MDVREIQTLLVDEQGRVYKYNFWKPPVLTGETVTVNQAAIKQFSCNPEIILNMDGRYNFNIGGMISDDEITDVTLNEFSEYADAIGEGIDDENNVIEALFEHSLFLYIGDSKELKEMIKFTRKMLLSKQVDERFLKWERRWETQN